MNNTSSQLPLPIAVFVSIVFLFFVSLSIYSYVSHREITEDQMTIIPAAVEVLPDERVLNPVVTLSEVVSGKKRYINTAYDYEFSYPIDWRVEEIIDESSKKRILATPTSKFVRLSSPDREFYRTFTVRHVVALPEGTNIITWQGNTTYYIATPDGERYFLEVPSNKGYLELKDWEATTGYEDDDIKIRQAFLSFKINQ